MFTTDIADNAVVSKVLSLIAATRTEICLFLLAVAAHMLLFRNRSPTKAKSPDGAKARRTGSGRASYNQDEGDASPPSRNQRRSAPAARGSGNDTQGADNVDHGQAYRRWSARRTEDTERCALPSGVGLTELVESMHRQKKDNPSMLQEIKTYLQAQTSAANMSSVNDLLESLGRCMNSSLVEEVMTLLPSIGLTPDRKSYELVLNMHFTMRNLQEVRAVVARMSSLNVPLTTRATIIVIKTALKSNNFEEARKYFKELRDVWDSPSMMTSSYSTAPRLIVSQLVDLACREHRLLDLLPDLTGVPLSEEVVVTMLTECNRQHDTSNLLQVEALARAGNVTLNDSIYSLLIKGANGDRARVQKLFREVIDKNKPGILTVELAQALLAYCDQAGDVPMAQQLYAHMQPKQLPMLSAFIRFFADHEEFEMACDVYEKDLKQLNTSSSLHRASSAETPTSSVYLDTRLERSLMNAALRCGRDHLAKNFLDASPSDIAKHITMIRNCADAKNLKGAIDVFEALQKSGTTLNSVVYNTVLDACVECKDENAAEKWMIKTKEAGMADVVTYNVLIKAHLQGGNFEKARSLMNQMREEGVQPNRVTFNELVNAMISKGCHSQRGTQLWDVIDEMCAAGVKPNQVTCSILLKNLNRYSDEAVIAKTLALITDMEEPMDEVLLSSVVEACVRVGKPDLLSSTLLKFTGGPNGITVNGSHTFGSLIKAYGHARDMDGVWRCWKEMCSRHIRPTSITLGCMVEAVVNNGDTEGAYELIHQIQSDNRSRDAVNSVIYCSVLKGFCREKKIDRVWSVYQEMQEHKVELSIVTFNTLIDACARCARMDHVPDIIHCMKTNQIRPNVITYSTMMKGHCQAGDIQMGFQILAQMKKETNLKPDEIMYNSLLDGCAQNSLVEEGLRIVTQMQEEGVPPSNFTLSILVKLMNRARRLEDAFQLVSDLTKKYGFRPNVHVYTNLIQACVSNRQLARGFTTLEVMIKERIHPDNRTYAILLRSSIGQCNLDVAFTLLRASLAIPQLGPAAQPGGQLAFLSSARETAVCHNLDGSLVNEVLGSLAEKASTQELVVQLMSDIRQHAPKVRIDSGTQRKVMSSGMSQMGGGGGGGGGGGWSDRPQQGQNQSKGKGKGKGGGARSFDGARW